MESSYLENGTGIRNGRNGNFLIKCETVPVLKKQLKGTVPQDVLPLIVCLQLQHSIWAPYEQ